MGSMVVGNAKRCIVREIPAMNIVNVSIVVVINIVVSNLVRIDP